LYVAPVGSLRETRAGLNPPAGSIDQSLKRHRGHSGCGVRFGAVMPITLQSTVGGFSSEFMQRLPDLEKAMVAQGLEPSEFVISKDIASTALPLGARSFFEYTVFIGHEHFTVAEPDDITFLDYLYQRCVAPDDEDEATPQRARRPGLIRRLFRWMERPI
jgi:hypothetical protein